MAPVPLRWKEGEGYDIHVLRGGPASKQLDQSFDIDPSFPVDLFPLSFIPRFKGGTLTPNPLGVEIDAATGAVTAKTLPTPTTARLRNFLLTARQDIGGGNTNESIIRIHVHDTIQKIWLTPSTLAVHQGSSERRFTVLALFDDNVIGDITEWPQIAYRSANATNVSVANTGDPDPLSPRPIALGGVFTVFAGASSVITAELKLTAPVINLTATGTVSPKTFWNQGGSNARVVFVSGPIAPSHGDTDPDSSSNVQNVIGSAANVLFLAEGFLSTQRAEFNKLVGAAIKELRTSDHHLPFKLFKESINYWSVFVPSAENVVSILGDQAINVMASPVPLPRKPAPTATAWTIENMIHEGGLPAPVEPSVADANAWLASRQPLYDMPAAAPTISAKDLAAWNGLKSRALLNERDTAFGLAHYDRPRASGQDQSEWRLMLDPRRTSEDSLRGFVEALTFGTDPATSAPIVIGNTWHWETSFSPQAQKDRGLICILSRDDTRGGTWMPGATPLPYFAANAGATELAGVTAATNGKDIQALPAGAPFSASILAARVARGCGHAIGLGDEYGSGGGLVAGPAVTGFNLQPQDSTIVTSPPGTSPRVIDASKIKWLWPRIAKAGVVDVQFSGSTLTSPLMCDANGTPNPAGTFLRMRLRRFPPEGFAKNDIVRFRGAVNVNTWPFWIPTSADANAAFALVVEKELNDDELILRHQTPNTPQPFYPAPSGTQLDLRAIFPFIQYSLIAPRMDGGNESSLVVDLVRDHIDSSDSPLNAAPGAQGAVCVTGAPPFAVATPTNPPPGPRGFPEPPARMIGLYDGGGHSDCGVFRPTGRCRMRDEFASTMPFCHVCSYIMVDLLDPSAHSALEKFFPEVRL